MRGWDIRTESPITCRRSLMRAAFLFLHAGAVSLMPTTKETAMNPNKPKSVIEAASAMEAGVSSSPGTGNRTRAFEGFPYLATRLVSLLHHIMLLPRSWQAEQLLGFARRQAQANCLPTSDLIPGSVLYVPAAPPPTIPLRHRPRMKRRQCVRQTPMLRPCLPP